MMKTYGCSKMGSIGRFMKYLVKSAFYHNPFDAFVRWHRRHIAKKGPENVYRVDQQVYWRFAYVMFPRILWLTNRYTFEGYENLKDVDGPFMVICNHNDALDPFYCGVAISCGTRDQRMHVAWVSKLANLHTPIMKSIISYFGTIPLGRGRKMDNQTATMIKEALRRGQGIGFFPEGSRGKTREDRSMIRTFHSGAARLCLEHKIPYIPVVLQGNRMFFKGKAHCRIGHPVYLDSSLECNLENARLVSIDMHAQMQALFEGRPDIPRSRFERNPPSPIETLHHAYVPLIAPIPAIMSCTPSRPGATTPATAGVEARPPIRLAEVGSVTTVPGQGELELDESRVGFEP